MAKRKVKTFVKQKRKGRPVTVEADVSIGIRLSATQLDAVDAWALDKAVSRSAAIRHLISRGLETEAVAKRRRKKIRKDETS
jgi:hypothetical protein